MQGFTPCGCACHGTDLSSVLPILEGLISSIGLASSCHLTHGAAVQYIKFLQKYLSRDTYERLLPSLDALISGFGLDVEVAWQVYRHLTTNLEPDTSASPEDGEVEELEGSAPKDALAVTAPSTPPITDAPTHIEDAGRDARALTETERRMWQHWQADSGADDSR